MDLETLENIKDRLNITRLSTPALIGVVVILVMVAVAAGRLLIGTATANEFELTMSESSSSERDVEESSFQEPETLFIHVSGEVVNPGLVQVESGARVADAIQEAGGFTKDAATGSVNLARVLSDGEQIVIAKLASEEAPVETTPSYGTGGANDVIATGGGLVNINTADATSLVSLPGIGESTAAKIIADRQANGSFKTVEDLKRVSGIGDKKFEALSGLICV